MGAASILAFAKNAKSVRAGCTSVAGLIETYTHRSVAGSKERAPRRKLLIEKLMSVKEVRRVKW